MSGPAVDAGQVEPLVEDAPGRTDERRALAVLAITRLLAHAHRD
ncbi:MAG TPA: hypothetical protein VFN33_04355 [Gaiellaceae bacterium]|nr:hypothetical protein [Gaiellaceae bacterium]